MDLWILNHNLEQIGVLDDYKSLIWSKRYNKLGDCEIYIGANERTIELLQKGNFVVRADDEDMMCRIETVELDTNAEEGDYLIVSGYDCRKILNQRIIWSQTNYTGTAENFIRKIINENVISPSLSRRQISNFRLATARGFTEALEIQSTYDYLFDKIQTVSETYGYGSRVKFDGTNFIFDLYKGTDRSIDQTDNDVVIFSPDFENLISTKYKSDSSGVKTAALVAGTGEGIERVTKEITGGTGLDRYELFVDAKDVSPEIPYTDLIATYPNGTIVEENSIVYYVVGGVKIAILNHIDTPTTATLLGEPYQVLLNQKGLEQLAEKKTSVSFDGEVEPNYSYKFGEDYYLGDIVTIRNEYGIGTNARITEVIESDDDNGYSIIPTFEYMEVEEVPLAALLQETGDPILTEDLQVLEVEGEQMMLTNLMSAPNDIGSGSKKISELPLSTDIYEGCCLPIVTNGETKRVTYAMIRDKVIEEAEIEPIDNATIDAICT